MTAFGICAVGFKGAEYLRELIQRRCAPEAVFTYAQSDDGSRGHERIVDLCRAHDIAFSSTKLPKFDESKPLIFVGWQHLIHNPKSNCIVFHDSLLPRYRGFAPTVNALLQGEPNIGVTAFKPTAEVDAGPIIGQTTIPVFYPIKIKEALSLQAKAMAQLTIDILPRVQSALACALEQEHARATYSIWRDVQDYKIDWRQSAAEIHRVVDALSFPYRGATTELGDRTLVIEAVSEVNDLTFPIRHPGKVWRLDSGKPVVICGSGMLRLDRVLGTEGEVQCFDRLRVRFT